jgi:hypothetical protein
VTVGEAVDGVGDATDDGVPVAAGFSSPSPQATTGNRISTSNTTAIVLKGEVSLLRNAWGFLPSITQSTSKGHSLYSSSTLVTLGRVRKSKLLQELLGRLVRQALLGADSIVHPFPGKGLTVELSHCPAEVSHLVELLGVGSVGPLHVAIELGRAGWQHEQVQPPLLAGLLEGGLEFGAPVYLDGADREGHPLLEGVEKAGSGLSGRPAGRHQHIPAADHVAGGEMFERDPWEGP